MDDQLAETLTKLRIELGIIGQKIDELKDVKKEVKSIDDVAKEALQSTRVAHKRLDELGANQTWLWRLTVGSLVAGAIGVLFYFAKLGGA